MKKTHERNVKMWHLVTSLPWDLYDRVMDYSHDLSEFERIEGPVILISNHVCNWDPILIGTATRNRQIYFVMSEHMVRGSLPGKIINFIFDPILIKKGTTDLKVVKNCIKHIKAGHSICLFAEGNQSWDGITGKVTPATGKLVKMSKATLITYRLEGAFLTHPRWATGTRRGKIEGRIAGIYTPEKLKKMSAEEVQHVIERDLYFDIWEWQRNMPGGPVAFKGRWKNRDYAKGIDMLFFMCPGCGKIGTIKTKNNKIFCGCGFKARFLNTGFIEPLSPNADHPPNDFTTLSGWDSWQSEELRKKVRQILASKSDQLLFKDGPVILSQVGKEHTDIFINKGELSLRFQEGKAQLTVDNYSFNLNEITDMGLVLSERILFTYEKEYYQIASKGINIRKYFLVWEMIRGSDPHA